MGAFTRRRWTPQDDEVVLDPSLNTAQKAERLGCSWDMVYGRMRRLKEWAKLPPLPASSGGASTSAGEPETTPPKHSKAPPVQHQVSLPKPEFGYLPLSLTDGGDWFRFGLVGDTHLCCKEERLAELHNFYDLLVSEGIRTVFHAGNLVDGYLPRINGDSVLDPTVDGQCLYVADNYPQREGVTTYFITGDDHEGWWQKDGFNFGAYCEFVLKTQGRNDMRYMGHVESDVELKHPGGASTIIKVQHPGGGSAYARSYTGQKQVEAFEGGEKPNVLVQGHYHVSNYMNDRNIHVISLPGFQDQTIFARKKRLRMEIGGAILSFKVNPDDGTLTRCAVEFVRYFTRGYYKRYLRSDARLCKGHLVLNP